MSRRGGGGVNIMNNTAPWWPTFSDADLAGPRFLGAATVATGEPAPTRERTPSAVPAIRRQECITPGHQGLFVYYAGEQPTGTTH
jgi:hypothetical protein